MSVMWQRLWTLLGCRGPKRYLSRGGLWFMSRVRVGEGTSSSPGYHHHHRLGVGSWRV